MDDNQNNDKNQSQDNIPKPIFESIPVEETPPVIQPEEVAPDVSSPEDALNRIPDVPGDSHPMYAVSDSHKGRFIFIALVILFFIGAAFFIFKFLQGGFLKPPSTVTVKDVTLTYWGVWEEKEVYDALIAEYQKKNPHVKINYEKVSPRDNYREKLIARKENGPDIFRYHGTWLPEIQEIVSALPTEVMSNQEFDKTFYPVFQKDLKIGDKYYGIPLYIDGLVLVYNNSLLKQAGIPAAPTVWISQGNDQNDMLTAVGKLTVKDASSSLVTSGLAAGTTSNVEHYSELFGLLLLLNGGDLKKLDSQQAAEALELYRKFAEEGYWTDSMPNSIAAFIQGKVAMIIVPSWQVLTIKTQNPDLDVKVAPVPKGLDGKSISLANYWAEGVSKYSKNQLEAWKFIKYLSEKDTMTKMFELQSKIRPFGTAYSRVDLADKLINDENLGAVISQAQSYISLPLTMYTYDNGLNNEIVQYIQNAINATSQGVDYKNALTQAHQGVSQVFNRYKIE